ncbi:hypothetical protein, partial [Pseudomonas sp. B26(2017)]|uniref:hypothetical protein n=1 Tax=Pseudomonas sp. B26(2017) TaxID=1981732 RepID=UPI001C47F3B5
EISHGSVLRQQSESSLVPPPPFKYQHTSELAREEAARGSGNLKPCISLVLASDRWQTANPFTPFVLRLYANVF